MSERPGEPPTTDPVHTPAPNERLREAAITLCGAGYAPIASGTWGSLVGVAVFVLVWSVLAALGAPRWLLEPLLVVEIAGSCWLCVLWGDWAISRFASTDPKPFVLDEYAGQLVALLLLPMPLGLDWWPLACLVSGQFLLFRFFDIAKVPPAAQMERLPSGWGVLVDDLVAGLYANIVGQVLWRIPAVAGVFGLSGVGYW